ncbi:MAG: hypothetical protein U9R60_13105, partial [Bacteroidota bacterium]|nr:hypothetical protein [Bacteroidota bacterium]
MEILPLKREDLPFSGEERCTFLFAKNRTSLFAKNCTFLIAKNSTLLFPVYTCIKTIETQPISEEKARIIVHKKSVKIFIKTA